MATSTFIHNKLHSAQGHSTRLSSFSSTSSSTVERKVLELSELDSKESQNSKTLSSKQILVHPYFIENNTNVQTTPTKLPLNIWKKLVPSPFEKGSSNAFSQQGVDVTSIFEDPRMGAEELMRQCGFSPTSSSPEPLSSAQYDETRQHLEDCLAIFQQTVSDSLSPSLSSTIIPTFKARIVSSRGQAGTKCPRWHLDHVPLRLILSLEGPGVCYIQQTTSPNECDCCEDKENENVVVNNSQEINTIQANKVIRDQYSNDKEIKAKAGEVVLLLGKTWENTIKKQREDGMKQIPPIEAAIHKSPTLLPLQGRVLLTVDVVLEEDNMEEDV